MAYPLKDTYTKGAKLSAVSHSDLATAARVLNDLAGVGIEITRTQSGYNWKIEINVDDATLEVVEGTNVLQIKADGVGPDELANTAVTAGSYTAADITVDAQGRITAASSGSIATGEIANNAVTSDKTTGYSGTINLGVPGTATVTNGLITSVP